MSWRVTYLLLFTLFACTPDKEEVSYKEHTAVRHEVAHGDSLDLLWPVGVTGEAKEVKGITFSFKPIRALDFLNRTGRRAEAQDKKELANESVLIFEMADTNEMKSVFDHQGLAYSQDQTVQYLCGGVMNDLQVMQDGKNYTPNGVQYEGLAGAGGRKLRTLIFLKGLDLDRPFTIQYNDPLFEAGLIRMNYKIKHVPV